MAAAVQLPDGQLLTGTIQYSLPSFQCISRTYKREVDRRRLPIPTMYLSPTSRECCKSRGARGAELDTRKPGRSEIAMNPLHVHYTKIEHHRRSKRHLQNNVLRFEAWVRRVGLMPSKQHETLHWGSSSGGHLDNNTHVCTQNTNTQISKHNHKHLIDQSSIDRSIDRFIGCPPLTRSPSNLALVTKDRCTPKTTNVHRNSKHIHPHIEQTCNVSTLADF